VLLSVSAIAKLPLRDGQGCAAVRTDRVSRLRCDPPIGGDGAHRCLREGRDEQSVESVRRGLSVSRYQAGGVAAGVPATTAWATEGAAAVSAALFAVMASTAAFTSASSAASLAATAAFNCAVRSAFDLA